MISEAVSARLPVVGVAPAAHRFTDEEQDYRSFLIDNGWCRVLPIAELTPDALRARAVRDRADQGEPARCACRQAEGAPAASCSAIAIEFRRADWLEALASSRDRNSRSSRSA